jgi:hypothetical protein
MWEIEINFIGEYVAAVGQAFDAFMPLWSATVGMFLAFAIANMVRFFLSRTVKQ